MMTATTLKTVRICKGLHAVTRDGKRTGHRLIEGSYQGTSDDRLGRWYIIHEDDDLMDKRGAGHGSIASALDELADRID